MEFSVFGVDMIFLAMAVIEAIKVLSGVNDKGKIAVALGVGFVFCAGVTAINLGLVPEAAMPWVQVVVYAIVGSLSVAGFYSLGKRAGSAVLGAVRRS